MELELELELELEEVSLEYGFAIEYDGPPVRFDIPRAVPINVERIPIASVVTQSHFPENTTLPVIQPVLPPHLLTNHFSKELTKLVSPTSIIDFERFTCGFQCPIEPQLTLSPTSLHVHVFDQSGKDFQVLPDLNTRFESGDWSGLISSSAELGSSSISHEHSAELGAPDSNFCPSEFSQSFDKLRDLSAVSEAFVATRHSLDNFNLEPDDLTHRNWSSSKSVLSVDYLTSSVSSFRTGECKSMPRVDGKRPGVTFLDSDSYDEELSYGEAVRLGPKKEPPPRSKKGACYRCLKGNRFTEKGGMPRLQR